MSHTAVFHYKGRETDPRTIGSELGVEAVLSGRLTKRNDVLSITLELVNAKDNSHIWGEQYDRKLSDLLALQREIPFDVSERLRVKLSGESKERLSRTQTDNLEAYQLYLKGIHSWEKWTQSGAKEAAEFFDEAIKKDPNYALAYSGLAAVYVNFGNGVGPDVPPKEAHHRAREAATKALSLDPELGEAHAAMAHVFLYDDWDFTGAERELRRAIELSPSYAEGHHAYSHLLLLLGRFDESFAESKKLLELDPVSETSIGHLAYHYLYARQFDEAIEQYKKDRQLYPDIDFANNFKLGEAYSQKGMFDEAIAQDLKAFAGFAYEPAKIEELKKAFAKSGMKGFYQKLLEQDKDAPQSEQNRLEIAELYARLGEKDAAFEWLEKAYAAHDDQMVRLKEELGYDNLRSDPRYADLLRRVGLPQ
jgi:tetratricopeptide (TPR) repeat protein